MKSLLQILNQIKIACLSYVNSPIEFGPDRFLNSDLVKVKDLIIKKCEHLNSELESVLGV